MMVEVETVAIAKKLHELLAIAEAAALERAARVVEEDHRSSPDIFNCASTASRIRALQPGSLLEDFEKIVRDDERQRAATVALPAVVVSPSLPAAPQTALAAAAGAALPAAPAVSSSALRSASVPAASAAASAPAAATAAAPSISSGRSIFSVRSNGSGASKSPRASKRSEPSKNGNSNGHWYSKTIQWLQGSI